MATAYGSYYNPGYNAFRARMDYSISSSNNTSATVQVVAKCQMGDGHDSGSNFSGTAKIGSSSSSYSGSGYYSAGGTYTMGTKTLSVTKTHSAQSVSVKVTVTSSGAWSGHSSTASATVTVPAKTSYTVSFNANGGSGAPSSQTKWYDETLTISSTKPTKTGYDFLGWSTSSTATTATYTAGGSYTTNSATMLYAVWAQAYIPPTISSIAAYRVDLSLNAADDGGYCKVECAWAVDTTMDQNNKGQTATIEYRLATESDWQTAKPIDLSTEHSASGTVSTAVYINNTTTLVPFADAAYKVRVTISDTSGNANNTASRVETLSPTYFTIDFRAGGHGLGIGHSADVEESVRCGMNMQIDGRNFGVIASQFNPGTAPATNLWDYGIGFFPVGETDITTVNGGTDMTPSKAFAYIRPFQLTDDTVGVQIEAQRTVGNTRTTTDLRLGVDSSGNRYYINTGAIVKSSSASKTIGTAGIDTHTSGPSVSLEAGKWVVIGTVTFNTRSSTGNTNSEIRLYNSTASSAISAIQRVHAYSNAFSVLSTAAVVNLSATSTIEVQGSSSKTYTTATTWYIQAQKVG